MHQSINSAANEFDNPIPLSTSFQPGAPLSPHSMLKTINQSISTQSTEVIDSPRIASPTSVNQSINQSAQIGFESNSFSSRLEGVPHPRTPQLNHETINLSIDQSTKVLTRRREGEGEKRTRTRSSRTINQTATQSTENGGELWQKLSNLKSLLNAGFITGTEYRDRKSQLIDEMTGTTLGSTTRRPRDSVSQSMNQAILPAIVPRGPPDFSLIQPERATKYTYDLQSRSWNATSVLVKLDPVPFSRGALRLVYHLQDLQEEEQPDSPTPTYESMNQSNNHSESSVSVSSVNSATSDGVEPHLPHPPANPPVIHSKSYVAKISMDPRDNLDREIYFRDVEIQTLAAYYAHLFNEYSPPKRVDFVKASILRLEERESAPLCGVERYIEGTYRKWNNNFGFVSEDERNTPQAFSHFSYESSNHRLLICDIQGVSDCYTDPQCHSIEQDGIGGKGNLGQRGIDRFLATHRCNAICRYLKLPSINANYSDLGTLPVTQYMSYEQVKVVNIQHFPRTAVSASLLQPSLIESEASSSSPRATGAKRGVPDVEDQQCKGFCTIL